MNQCVYLHCMYSNTSVFNVRKHIAKCRFKKSCVNTTCIPSNKQSRTLSMENDIINDQALACPADDVWRGNCIVDNCSQEEHAGACICDCSKVISEPYNSGRERHATQIVDRPQAEKFELNGIRKTLMDVYARS